MDLNQLLAVMTKQGASDLHLKPTRPPLVRLNGKLLPLKADPLTREELEGLVREILTPAQKAKLDESLSVDIGYGVQGVARFRGNIYMQRGNLAVCFRRVPYEVKEVEELNLPKVLLDFCTMPMGLVLVTGPTGSGKSTTLAALIKYISRTQPAHLITIEDPIEFLFADQMASISQRELGTDTYSFTEALRNSLRQDPDVIMVGEMRDAETISTVITAAETGHLVFSTLHTNSATQTIDRILDSFPGTQQSLVRAQLAQVLKGVVSMKLVEKKDKSGRMAALEIMRGSPRIAELIEKGETTMLHEELESSVGYYRMQSMNQSLLALLVHSEISYEEAMSQSADPEDLSLKLRRMFPNIEEKGHDMATSDFAEIQELQQFRKLYEEQEEKTTLRMSEKDEQVAELSGLVNDRDQQLRQHEEHFQEMKKEAERMRADYGRLKDEAEQKIKKLMERIKDLNQRISPGSSGGGDRKSGIFR
jgi:twitching motility protein PilT